MIAATQNMTSVIARNRWRLLKFGEIWGDCDEPIRSLFEAAEPEESIIPFLEDVLEMNIICVGVDG